MKPAFRPRHRTWAIEDHLCRHCGGRILRCVTGNGITGGGNPVFKCADCGVASAAMGPDALCWCGFSHKHNHNQPPAYRCLPFAILETRPALKQAFLSCGCDPARGEVGIVLERDLAESQPASLPASLPANPAASQPANESLPTP